MCSDRGSLGEVYAAHAPVRLSGAVAVVAGASGGIGRAVSLELLSAGAEVHMLGRSLPRLHLPPVAAELPGVAHYIVTDLSAEHAAEEVAVRLQPRRGIDVLVISSGAYARSQDRAGFEDLLAANLLGPYALVRRLLPSLVGAQGQVVFINSTQALKATAEVGQYAATKHAMKAIADSLRDEVNLEGVRVASMFLGRTATGMQEAIFAAEGREYTPERLVQPEDVARIVLSVLRLPRTAEVTDLVIRPMRNPQQLSHRGRIG